MIGIGGNGDVNSAFCGANGGTGDVAIGTGSAANGGNGAGNGCIAIGVGSVSNGTSSNANGNGQARSVAINGGHNHQRCTCNRQHVF
ncbi:MAG TPA: hypothetical protein VFI73_04845 [Candidatus Nitrosopolaris sp.]|nr:hypothetical protein [Candidatus Nitrosopolaris sp.]